LAVHPFALETAFLVASDGPRVGDQHSQENLVKLELIERIVHHGADGIRAVALVPVLLAEPGREFGRAMGQERRAQADHPDSQVFIRHGDRKACQVVRVRAGLPGIAIVHAPPLLQGGHIQVAHEQADVAVTAQVPQVVHITRLDRPQPDLAADEPLCLHHDMPPGRASEQRSIAGAPPAGALAPLGSIPH
jgi:hypothetical protein